MNAVENLIQNLNELKTFTDKLSKLISENDNICLNLLDKINQRVNEMSKNCEQAFSDFHKLKRRNKTFHSYLIELACLLLQGNDVLSEVDPIKSYYEGNRCKLVETQEKYFHLKKRLKNFELNVRNIKNILSAASNDNSKKLTEKEIVKQVMDLHNFSVSTGLLDSEKGMLSSDSKAKEPSETIAVQLNSRKETVLKIDNCKFSDLQLKPAVTQASTESNTDNQKNDFVNKGVLKEEKLLPLEKIQKKTTNGFDFQESFHDHEKKTVKRFKLDSSFNKMKKSVQPRKQDRTKFKQTVLTFLKQTENEVRKISENKVESEKKENFKVNKIESKKSPKINEINNEKITVIENSDSDSNDYIESSMNKIVNEEKNEEIKKPSSVTPLKNLEIDLDETYVSSPMLKKYNLNSKQIIQKERSPVKELSREKSPVYDFVSPEYRKTSKKSKSERMNLNGHTCFNCEKYYKTAVPNLDANELNKMLNKCSRHRAKNSSLLNETPAGFWKPYLTNTDNFSSGEDDKVNE